MSADTPFFRVRWTLRARTPLALHTRQNAILYALLCDAARGDRADGFTQLPDGLLLDAPESARDRLDPGTAFAFGATVVASDPLQAARRVHALCDGLSRVGHTTPRKPVALGGNFDLVDVQDLVAGVSVAPGAPFRSLPRDTITAECERLTGFLGRPITLRFLSPLRLELPGTEGTDGHRFADATHLVAGQLLRAVQKRLAAVGIYPTISESEEPFPDSAIALVENRLVWLDLGYGPRDRRKSLGGALGRVRIAVSDPGALAALVWGQYARVGRTLHFGFGCYRIEELGPDPTECRRAVPLLDLTFTPPAVARAAADHDLDPGDLLRAANACRSGAYRPDPPQSVTIRDPDGSERELRIPTRTDRALQRLMLSRLGPAFDRLFETSSFAWRRGLSRESAARRIERLVNDGWAFAVRADFDRFFDRIPQDRLRDRLEAWAGDDDVVGAVMAFVRGGCPNGVGVPTGAPLSPLLGNLFLDRFDEEIERDGGRLVRYADDFLVLSRTRETAEALHTRCHTLASGLLLQLNDDATVLDLQEPFAFLGYHFQHANRWRYDGPAGPRRVRELGWRDADRTPSPLELPLPGEVPAVGAGGAVIVGPSVERLDVVGDAIEVVKPDGGDTHRIPLSAVERLIVLGPVGWTADAPGKLLRAGVPVQLVSEGGWPLGELVAETADDPDALAAQCRAAADPDAALRIAKPLVRAKLGNFATLLAVAGAGGTAEAAVGQLRELARDSAAAGTLDSLRGVEGAGAALWFRCLPSFLGRGFRFARRVSPDADDPVNVLLNIGHTMLHRHAAAAVRAAGLSPAVGFLHRGTGRYAALAADLQEPFRHLIDRAVIVATRRLRPVQFLTRTDGGHRLVLDANANRSFHALLQRTLRAGAVGRGQTEPRSWLAQLLATARGLRRHLLDPSTPWEPFEHP